jgi:hypothetical protein
MIPRARAPAPQHSRRVGRSGLGTVFEDRYAPSGLRDRQGLDAQHQLCLWPGRPARIAGIGTDIDGRFGILACR